MLYHTNCAQVCMVDILLLTTIMGWGFKRSIQLHWSDSALDSGKKIDFCGDKHTS